MNIYPIENNVPMQGKKDNPIKRAKKYVEQKAIDVVHNTTVKEDPKVTQKRNKLFDILSNPAGNRTIIGATAIVTQPFIDKNNHKVDKETRRVSTNRTIAKIIVGTTIGVIVRSAVYNITKKMTDINGTGKYSKSLLPKKYLKELTQNENYLKNYRNAIAMTIAITVMSIFTNFLIDAPLTSILTNKLNSLRKEDKKSA